MEDEEEEVGGGGAGSLDALLFVFDGDPEALLQQRQLTDEICDGVGERLLHTDTHKVC